MKLAEYLPFQPDLKGRRCNAEVKLLLLAETGRKHNAPGEGQGLFQNLTGLPYVA